MVERKTDKKGQADKFEQQIHTFESNIEAKAQAAKSLLLSLIALAREQEVFPKQEFVYSPDRVGSLVATSKKEDALLFNIDAQHNGSSRFIMLMGDGSMVRFFERRYLPKNGNYDRNRVHHNGDRREVLTDYEYVVRTPHVARTILSLISK